MPKKVSKKHKKLLQSQKFKEEVTKVLIDLGVVPDPRTDAFKEA